MTPPSEETAMPLYASFADELLARGKDQLTSLPAPRNVTDRLIAVAVACLSGPAEAYRVGDACAHRLLTGPASGVRDKLEAVRRLAVPDTGVWLEFAAPALPIPGIATTTGLLLVPLDDTPGGPVQMLSYKRSKKGQLGVLPGVVTVRPSGETRPPDRTPAQWAARRAAITASPAITILQPEDREAGIELMERVQAGIAGMTRPTAPGDAPFSEDELDTMSEQAMLAILLLHAIRNGMLLVEEPIPGGRVPVRCVSIPASH